MTITISSQTVQTIASHAKRHGFTTYDYVDNGDGVFGAGDVFVDPNQSDPARAKRVKCAATNLKAAADYLRTTLGDQSAKTAVVENTDRQSAYFTFQRTQNSLYGRGFTLFFQLDADGHDADANLSDETPAEAQARKLAFAPQVVNANQLPESPEVTEKIRAGRLACFGAHDKDSAALSQCYDDVYEQLLPELKAPCVVGAQYQSENPDSKAWQWQADTACLAKFGEPARQKTAEFLAAQQDAIKAYEFITSVQEERRWLQIWSTSGKKTGAEIRSHFVRLEELLTIAQP